MKHADDQYSTLKGHGQGIFRDKGSKFIALSCPACDEESVRRELVRVKNQYHDARHHCYAYRIGHGEPLSRANDDGEPSGTAGKPILGQILSHGLYDALIIVVRYFGGTKLGVRGLINAYKGAAADSISNNTIVRKTIRNHYRLHFDYPSMHAVMRILKEHDLPQHAHDFSMSCKIDFSVRKSTHADVLRQFAALPNVRIEKISAG